MYQLFDYGYHTIIHSVLILTASSKILCGLLSTQKVIIAHLY